MPKVTELPTADDIRLLTRFIREQMKEAIHNKDDERLKKLVLSGLILFNKRRPMEVEELTIDDYRRALHKKQDYTSEVVKSLTTSEAMVAKR